MLSSGLWFVWVPIQESTPVALGRDLDGPRTRGRLGQHVYILLFAPNRVDHPKLHMRSTLRTLTSSDQSILRNTDFGAIVYFKLYNICRIITVRSINCCFPFLLLILDFSKPNITVFLFVSISVLFIIAFLNLFE